MPIDFERISVDLATNNNKIKLPNVKIIVEIVPDSMIMCDDVISRHSLTFTLCSVVRGRFFERTHAHKTINKIREIVH